MRSSRRGGSFSVVEVVSFASRPLEPTPASSTRRDATAAHAPRGAAPRVVRRRDARARFPCRVPRPRPGLRARRGGAALFPSRGTHRGGPPRDGASPPADARASTRRRSAGRRGGRGRARVRLRGPRVRRRGVGHGDGTLGPGRGDSKGGPDRGADESVRVRLCSVRVRRAPDSRPVPRAPTGSVCARERRRGRRRCTASHGRRCLRR
jgi:hypothetical protein